ncbi:MAG: hypothetical protein SPK23_01275 [Eubacteriales bacterium]|nr:hypothetical protein [Clostridiales bacterium]MDY5835746.1 hypothetical protein [Eubacteriales bacterium]
MKIIDFLYQLKEKLVAGAKDNDLSIFVEDTLCDNFRAFEAENAFIANEMNDYLPDICEQMEPGMESDKFHQELLDEVGRLIDLLEN